MNLNTIRQLAETADLGTIEGNYTMAHAVSTIYEKYYDKKDLSHYTKKLKDVLNVKVTGAFIWLKIHRNMKLTEKYKDNMPVNKYSLYAVSLLPESEIIKGIKIGQIHKYAPTTEIRTWMETLESFKKRCPSNARNKQMKESKVKETKNIENNLLIDYENKISELEKRIEVLEQKPTTLFNPKSINDRLDLMQKLIMNS